MGIYIDYFLRADCSEETLRQRLERVRQRCLDLPLRSVGEVQRVAPVYNFMVFMLLLSEGHALPELIAERLRQAEEDRDHTRRCLSFAPMLKPDLPKRQLDRYYEPLLRFIENTDLWRAEDLPEKFDQSTPFGFSPFTVYRRGIEFEFASLMLRYGYMLLLDPGEGCETVALALSTFGVSAAGPYAGKHPLWYGQGFTKTQYAENFVQAHETVCQVLDISREERLLQKGRDNCGYYASRKWEDASKRVNEELAFARAVSGMFGLAVGNMREEGADVQVIVDNASKATPVDFSAALEREREAQTD